MKQMGMVQENVPASKVIIEKTDGSKTIINNPSITKIKMQGQETFQISGEINEEIENLEDDVKTIIEKTNCTEQQAEEALKQTGDLAEAILKLSS